MQSIFGVPMNTIMIVMLVMLVLSLAAVIYVAIRRPVIFRMGMRNIPRRKTQSILIVVGLMLATLITTAALTVGDSLNHSVGGAVYELMGQADEVVVSGNADSDQVNLESILTETMPADAVDTVRTATADLPVDAVGGVVMTTAPVISIADSGETDFSTANPQDLFAKATASEPMVGVIAADQQTMTDFDVRDIDGNIINVDQLGADKVYINEMTADALDIGVGSHVVYAIDSTFYTAEVVGITPTMFATGSYNVQTAGMVVGIDHFREATGKADGWSAVLISNTGGERAGVSHSEEVTSALETSFAGTELKVQGTKAELLDQAELIGSLFVTMFIGFGLFSIAVGTLLIVLIFTMLAAERRGEMGMMRAIGGQRRQLVQQFLSEGAGYTLLSGLVGAALGIVAAWIISSAVGRLTGGLFNVELYVHPRSLVVAYALGVIITFLAVIFSSYRASRLNVVAALRDIPEVHNTRASKKPLIWSALGLVFGGWLIVIGHSNPNVSLFLIGISVVPFALAYLAVWAGAPSRLAYTLAATIVLVVWAMPDSWSDKIFGDLGDGGIELFFLSGIAMVASSTVIIMQHMDLLLRVVQRLGGRVRGWLASIRLGVAYPQSNPGRSGMTIAMFSLIVFSIVVMACINNFFSQAFMSGNAMAGLNVSVQMIGPSPVDDITAQLTSDGVNLDGVSAPGKAKTLGPVLDEVQITGEDGATTWESSSLVTSMDDGFIDLTQFAMEARADGYATDADVWNALKTEPNVAIVASSMIRSDSGFGAGDPGTSDLITLNKDDDGTFAPITVTLRGQDDKPVELTVIGVIDADYSMFSGYFVGQPTLDALASSADPVATTWYFKVDDSRDSEQVAADMERSLLRYGAQGTDIVQQLKEFQAQQNGFMTVLQWFMGLGLIVGIAAVGVISYRAVVERRQQIGVLRALGFQSTTIGRAFVIETGIIVILGSLAGVILGLIVSYNITTADSGFENVAFSVPWQTVLVTLGMAIGMALLMSWLPARQASRVVPAEALRYE